MRIFYAADKTPNAHFKSNIWRNNLYLSLIDLGHDVVEFDYELKKIFQNLNQKEFIKKNRPKISNELLQQIKKAHKQKPIEVFFSYFNDACAFPETIDEIKSMGITTINWFCNGSYQLHLVSQISPHYDYCLVPEKFRLNDYKKMGANPIYCQEAANPNFYKPYNLKQEFDVTFVGQAYGERPDYIKFLYDKNIDIRVWGSGWHDFENKLTRKIKRTIFRNKNISPALLPTKIIGPILSDTEMIKMYSRSKINLGLSTCGNTHTNKKITQIRLRDFEVPMSGGFYMVEFMPELEEFFEIDKEIVCYQNKEDLVEKIKYFLKNDSKRKKIALAGRKRCLKDHTWQKRFEIVLRR
jgi:spore maturation protein CgeB